MSDRAGHGAVGMGKGGRGRRVALTQDAENGRNLGVRLYKLRQTQRLPSLRGAPARLLRALKPLGRPPQPPPPAPPPRPAPPRERVHEAP